MGKRAIVSPSAVPTQLELAWAAGIIDGEGCIIVYVRSTRNKVEYELRVSVVNTNEPIIRKFVSFFGGGFSKRKTAPQRRTVAEWRINGRKAASCLRQVLPYMVGKKPEATLALEFADTLVPYTSYNANSGIGAPRPHQDVLDRREAIRLDLQRLKRVEYTFSDFVKETA